MTKSAKKTYTITVSGMTGAKLFEEDTIMKNNSSIKTVVAVGIGAALFFVLGRFVAIPSPVPNTNISLQYAVLALLIFQALTAFDRKKNRGCMALGITAAYAATDEFHQLFVPGRAGRVTDVLIDSAGAFLALLAIHIILYYHKSEIRNRKR